MSERRVRWGERRRQARAALALCAVLLAAGCGGDNGPDPIDVQGAWSGTVTGSQSSGTLSFTVTETNGAVTGTGQIQSSSDAQALAVTGTYSEPHVALTLTADGFEPINLSATVAATSMTGTLNGSGFNQTSVTLTRQ